MQNGTQNNRDGLAVLPDEILKQMSAHAASEPIELCGFIYENHYEPLTNVLRSPYRFYADPAQVARMLSCYGEPLAIFHTHPNGNLHLSDEDRSLWYYRNSTMIVGCIRDGHLHWKMYGNRSD